MGQKPANQEPGKAAQAGPRASRPDPDALRVPFMVLNPGHIPKSPRNPGSVSKLL